MWHSDIGDTILHQESPKWPELLCAFPPKHKQVRWTKNTNTGECEENDWICNKCMFGLHCHLLLQLWCFAKCFNCMSLGSVGKWPTISFICKVSQGNKSWAMPTGYERGGNTKYILSHQHQEWESERGQEREREGERPLTTVIFSSFWVLHLQKLKLNYSSHRKNK